MLIIFGKKISEDKKIRYALTTLYGIGYKKACEICDKLNIPPQATIKSLNETKKLEISQYIKQNLIIEDKLKKLVKKNIQNYISNTSIRGFRHRHKLPVRGQRTHTNGKTQKKK